MHLATLFPHLAGFRLDALTAEPPRLILDLTATRRAARCPRCRGRSSRVQSRYTRHLADQPVSGRPVLLRLTVRRFRCRRRRCPQRIFAERFPTLTAVRARRTLTCTTALTAIGFALGGAPGARLVRHLGLASSRSTLLRLVRAAPLAPSPEPRIVGLDDWAWRRGQRYGSILVDLERNRAIDLLPDRTPDTVAAWLRGHPEITLVSRDRSGSYADGVRQGAPAAIQVADRFHLLCNVGEALERVLDQHHGALRDAASTANHAVPRPEPIRPARVEQPVKLTRLQQDQPARRTRRLARYGAVCDLAAQGMSRTMIGHQLGLSPKTVRRFLRAGSFPERARHRSRRSLITPYEPYLQAQWTAGCQNAQTLWREIHAQGFTGAPSLVRRHVASWRTGPARHGRAAQILPAPDALPTPPTRRPWKTPSPRQARWLLLKAPDDRQPFEAAFCEALLEHHPAIQQAWRLTAAFQQLIRERDKPALAPWLQQAEQSDIAVFVGFAAGLRRDLDAVTAALTAEWSNGQTEGQVNRLKCLKRQMYGRAKLDLLRQRFLHAA